MAFYQVLYWKDIPTQVKAWDDFDEIKVELDARFMVKVDRVAQSEGYTQSGSYLDQFNWGDEKEQDGQAQEVADSIKAELEASYK